MMLEGILDAISLNIMSLAMLVLNLRETACTCFIRADCKLACISFVKN